MSKFRSPLFRERGFKSYKTKKFSKENRPWEAARAYAFDGSTTYGRAPITTTTELVNNGYTILLWSSRATDDTTAINITSFRKDGSNPVQQIFPGTSAYRMRGRYADQNDVITPGATIASAPTIDTNNYFLTSVWLTTETPPVSWISYSFPGGENTGTTVTQAGQIISDNFDSLWFVTGNGISLTYGTIVCAAVFFEVLSEADRAAFFAAGKAKDWVPIAQDRQLSMQYYWRLEKIYQVGSTIYCPNDGWADDGLMEIVNGDFSDLVTTIPTGVS